MVLKDERVGFGALNLTAVIKGALIALVITVLGSALAGAVYRMSGLAEGSLPAVSTVLFYLSILVGSFWTACSAGSRGMLHGLAVAFLIVLLGLLMSGLFFDFKAALENLPLRSLLSGVLGAVGGVLGVSLSR